MRLWAKLPEHCLPLLFYSAQYTHVDPVHHEEESEKVPENLPAARIKANDLIVMRKKMNGIHGSRGRG